jgi:hypothetical protein
MGLLELGDVEELWESRFEEPAESYAVTLGLAARFQAAGRYPLAAHAADRPRAAARARMPLSRVRELAL